jgi:hypothetical protein
MYALLVLYGAGLSAADKDKAFNKNLRHESTTTDSRSSPPRPIAPVPTPLSDEQLTWEQFMNAKYFL